MPTTYTEPTDLAKLHPPQLASRLRALTEHADQYFARMPAFCTVEPIAPGKWTALQLVGHLCDSAANNIQRVVRLQLAPELTFPGYQQDEWVNTQGYSTESWADLRALFSALNKHLAHIIAKVDPAHLAHIWHYTEGDLTLGFIIEDYIAHLKHHLKALPGFPATAL